MLIFDFRKFEERTTEDYAMTYLCLRPTCFQMRMVRRVPYYVCTPIVQREVSQPALLQLQPEVGVQLAKVSVSPPVIVGVRSQ